MKLHSNRMNELKEQALIVSMNLKFLKIFCLPLLLYKLELLIIPFSMVYLRPNEIVTHRQPFDYDRSYLLIIRNYFTEKIKTFLHS
jgi:hypothetical protein